MFGFIVFCLVLYMVFRKAGKTNQEYSKRRYQLEEAAKQQSASTSSKGNRALQSMRERMQQSVSLPKPVDRQMPIEERRRQQQAVSDRSRIHQSLHKKEDATRTAEPAKPSEGIHFEGNELMDEVYAIMACGYPSGQSTQRDFLAEGMELIDRYTLPEATLS